LTVTVSSPSFFSIVDRRYDHFGCTRSPLEIKRSSSIINVPGTAPLCETLKVVSSIKRSSHGIVDPLDLSALAGTDIKTVIRQTIKIMDKALRM
jgi:hypothetical protein